MHKFLLKYIFLILMSVPAVVSADEVTDSVVQPTNLDEVVVTGVSQPVSRNLLPYSVSVIDRSQLEESGSSQVLSILSGMVPSLFVTQRNIIGFGVSGGGSGHIKMRGVGGDRASGVLMMVDGQPQFAGLYSHHVADFYKKEYVERVEVLRGPASVLYGSNAMAGVINVITRQAEKDGVGLTLTSQFGSYNTWLTSLTNTVKYGRFSSLLSLSYDRTDGIRENFDFKQRSGYAKVAYDINNHWKAVADYTITNFKASDPVYPTISDPNSTAVYRQSITRGEASATAINRYGGVNGVSRIYYSYGNHYVDDPRHFHSTDDRFGIILYQNFRPWRDASATIGFDFDIYSGRIPVSGGVEHTPGSLSTLSKRTIAEYSPYVTVAQNLFRDKFTIDAGLRVANSNRFTTRIVPQIGVAYNPAPDWNIKASVTSGYRNPSFRELYLYRMANPDLSPEQLTNFEVSAGHRFSNWLKFDVTLYYSKGSNMIQTIDMKNQNTGRFINKGVEVALSSRPLTNLRLSASYSYLHTSLHNLSGAPRHQYFLGADWKPVSRLDISADLKGVVSLFVSEGIERQDYALLNLRVGYDVLSWLNLFLQLDNITDTRYIINRGYDMPGFTMAGGFRVQI